MLNCYWEAGRQVAKRVVYELIVVIFTGFRKLRSLEACLAEAIDHRVHFHVSPGLDDFRGSKLGGDFWPLLCHPLLDVLASDSFAFTRNGFSNYVVAPLKLVKPAGFVGEVLSVSAGVNHLALVISIGPSTRMFFRGTSKNQA